jgi:hypothetical protein
MPEVSNGFVTALSRLLARSVFKNGDAYTILPSNEIFLPTISFDANSTETFAKADFDFISNEILSVYITNITGVEKRNTSPYRHFELEDVNERFTKSRMEVARIDHIGFDLPWFKIGVHPAMADLRNRLKSTCLYHLFPTGEPWDFIIPGELAEIRKRKAVDYCQIRKPKFEIVSFDKTSIPLIQIDMEVEARYAAIDIDCQLTSVTKYCRPGTVDGRG